MKEPRKITTEEFDKAMTALEGEIGYVNSLPIRTEDEAKDVPGFATLLRRYLTILEETWADNAGEEQLDGQIQVTECLHILRKITGIGLRAMIYNGVKHRETST